MISVENNNTIQKLISAWEDVKSKNEILNKRIGELVHKNLYIAYQEGKDITFKELAQLPLGEELTYPTIHFGRMLSTKIYQDNKVLEFHANFSPEATLARHIHSDCVELIKVVSNATFRVILGSRSKGTLREILLNQGEEIYIKAKEQHQVTNISNIDADIIVKFIKEDGQN